MKKLLARLSELAARYNLLLSSQELLPRGAFGMDIRSRQLLVVSDAGSSAPEHRLLPLRTIRACTVRKEYRDIRPGALRNGLLSDFLKTVELRIDFGTAAPLVLSFYQHSIDRDRTAPGAERKAELWARAIGQLLGLDRTNTGTPKTGAGEASPH